MSAMAKGFVNFVRTFANNIQTLKPMKYLNVAEKHDAAKTIAALLSRGSARRREGYSVYNKVFDFEACVKGTQCKMVMTSVSGHLMQMEFLVSYRNWSNIDPEALFEAPIRKACIEDLHPVKRTLEREIKTCQGLIIWTDCDREGENIGFEIINVCRNIKPNIAVYRAIFSEITAQSVIRALQNLKKPDKNQSDAVDVRAELDLRTGAAITRYQTMRFQRIFPEKIADKLISYGSCQIPTLGFVAERYKEVEAFVSEPFWKLVVTHTIDDLTVNFNWARIRLFDKDACEDYLMLCLSDPKAFIENVSVKPKNKWRPIAMDTVEMEKLGSRKLKLSAKEIMQVAEKLYTKGVISYPRTETNIFSKEIDLKSLVDQQTSHPVWGSFALHVQEWGPNPRNGNKSDQAHPPIHPTKMVTNLEGNEARVYEMICRHFLACVSKDATGSETIVNIKIAGEKFSASGLCIYERNYLDVYIYEKWNAKQIHNYVAGTTFEPSEISMSEGSTASPPLLTEADLIALMEKHGIGTDATHAEHINTIKERGYIGVVDNGCLVPGVIGMGLYEGYNAMEIALAKPNLRAQFEADLKKICRGEKEPKTVLQEQIKLYKEAYKKITERIEEMDQKLSLRINESPTRSSEAGDINNYENHESNQNKFLQIISQCPKCKSAHLCLKERKNKMGFYIGCLNFPDCKNVVWLPEELKEISVIDEDCQRCGDGSKLLKFKFSTGLYKNMFNAFGPYKTCLRCDTQLRNAFNINIDNIKAVGGIVSEETTTNTIMNGHASPAPSKSKATTINAYFRSIPSSVNNNSENINNLAGLNDIPMDDIFEDGFDEFLIDSEEAIMERIGISSAHTRTSNNAARSTDLEILSWGTGGIQGEQARSTNDSVNQLDDSNLLNDIDYTWGTGSQRSNNRTQLYNDNQIMFELNNDDEVIKCSNCNQVAKKLTVKKEGPNKGRQFFVCSNRNPCGFFQWGNSSQADNAHRWMNSNSSQATVSIVACNCGVIAKSLIVRKEGPNIGRSFYACGKTEGRCNFFKWCDGTESEANTSGSSVFHNQSWGQGSSRLNSSTSENVSTRKTRKCGLCRQEGHTKQKCPRKNEFEA